MGVLKDFDFSFDLTISDFTTNESMTAQQQLNNLWKLSQSFIAANYANVIPLPSNTPNGSAGFAIFFFSLFGQLLQISSTRFINPTVTQTVNTDGVNIDKITFSSRIINSKLNNPPLANDYLPANAVGNWLLDVLKVFNFSGNQNLSDLCALNYNPKYNSLNEQNILNAPVPKNTVFKNGLCTLLSQHFTSNIFEHASNTSGGPTDPSGSIDDPEVGYLSILDYIFQYSYFLSFIGAVSFALSNLIGISPLIIMSEKVLMGIHLIVGFSAFVSIFAWFNSPIWFIDSKVINSENVSKTNNLPFLS